MDEAPIRQKITSNDSLYFFLRIGTNGKRINSVNKTGAASKKVQTYAAKWLIEKDTINILINVHHFWNKKLNKLEFLQVKFSNNLGF